MKNKMVRSAVVAGVFCAALCCVVFPASAEAAVARVSLSGTLDYGLAANIVTEMNRLRESVGARPLVADNELTEYAMERAVEIAIYAEHIRTDGTNPMTVTGTRWKGSTRRAENIAGGQQSVAAAVDAWHKSEGHWKNAKNPEFTITGTGVAEVNGVFYWVQLFGNGSGAQPVARTGRMERTYSFVVTERATSWMTGGNEEIFQFYSNFSLSGTNNLRIGQREEFYNTKSNTGVYRVKPGRVHLVNMGWPAMVIDVTAPTQYEIADPSVLTVEDGVVKGLKDGETDLRVTVGEIKRIYHFVVGRGGTNGLTGSFSTEPSTSTPAAPATPSGNQGSQNNQSGQNPSAANPNPAKTPVTNSNAAGLGGSATQKTPASASASEKSSTEAEKQGEGETTEQSKEKEDKAESEPAEGADGDKHADKDTGAEQAALEEKASTEAAEKGQFGSGQLIAALSDDRGYMIKLASARVANDSGNVAASIGVPKAGVQYAGSVSNMQRSAVGSVKTGSTRVGTSSVQDSSVRKALPEFLLALGCLLACVFMLIADGVIYQRVAEGVK